MLKQLRSKKTAKRIFIVLASIIVPAFVLWGSGGMMREKQRSNFAGEIFGKKVSMEEYRQSFLAVRTQALIQFGDNFYQAQPFLDLETRAWERLILLYKARQERINISDEEVVKTIASFPFFQENSKFNPEIYQQILRYGFELTPKEFEIQVRDSLSIEELFRRFSKQLKVSEEELLEEFKKESEKIKVAYIAFNNSDFSKDILINEEGIEEYFQKHKEDFLTKASLNMEYIGINVAEKSNPSEKQEAKNKMLSIASGAKNESNWQELSKKQSISYKLTGFFEFDQPIPEIGWSEEFLKALLGLKPGGTSELIETERGFFVVRLLGLKEPHLPEFQKAKEKVKEALQKEKAKALSLAKAQEYKAIFEERLKNNPRSDFKTIASELKLPVKETESFTRNQYLEGIGMSTEFAQSAFSLIGQENKLSIAGGPQASYLIKLVTYVPLDIGVFKKEKGKYQQKIEAQKKEEMFFKFLQTLKDQARLKNNLTQAAKERQ